jgi:hypothetical protein
MRDTPKSQICREDGVWRSEDVGSSGRNQEPGTKMRERTGRASSGTKIDTSGTEKGWR